MKDNIIELWLTDKQLKDWSEDADTLHLTIWEYIRRCVDAYSSIMHQHDSERK